MTSARRTANRTPHLAADIRRIIGTYAMRRDVGGAVLLCEPRSFELSFYPVAGNPNWAGNTGKVCYPDRLNADLAAKAINALPGADPVQSYRCPREGHFHHVDQGRVRREANRIVFRIAAAARRARP